jgi:hypothetical protein
MNIQTTYTQSVLHKRIEEKLTLLKSVENEFPCFIIVHDIRDSTVVYMCTAGLKNIGVTLEQLINMGVDYYPNFFNPEDAKDYVPKIFGLLERNNDDEIITFFQQVRRSPKEDWEWYLSATKIFVRDDEGKPVLTITTATPVDAQHHIAAKAQRLLEENNFLRRNHKIFDQLTKREKEVFKINCNGFKFS